MMEIAITIMDFVRFLSVFRAHFDTKRNENSIPDGYYFKEYAESLNIKITTGHVSKKLNSFGIN